MEQILKLAIDIDGVLADFNTAFSALVNSIEPGTIPEGYQPKDWNWTDKVSPALMNKTWKKLKASYNWWIDMPGYSNNIKALQKFLVLPDIEVYYVTSRVPSAGLPLLEQISLWLNFFGLVNHRTSVIPVSGASGKAAVVKALGIHYAIDDNIENVQAMAVPCFKSFVHTRSWNTSFDWPHRVSSLQEFLEVAQTWQ